MNRLNISIKSHVAASSEYLDATLRAVQEHHTWSEQMWLVLLWIHKFLTIVEGLLSLQIIVELTLYIGIKQYHNKWHVIVSKMYKCYVMALKLFLII